MSEKKHISGPAAFIHELESVIAERKERPSEDSYTNKLLSKGLDKVAQKFGEEAVELLIEARDEEKREDPFLEEAADLLYHYLVLLSARGKSLEDVGRVLKERHKT